MTWRRAPAVRPSARGKVVARVTAWGAAALVVAAGTVLALAATTQMPSFETVRRASTGSEALLLDRHGGPLHRLRLDHSRRQLDWMTLDQVAPSLPRALVAAEDRRFWWHPGVDPLALLAALRDNVVSFTAGRARGASTITMQLAGLIDASAGQGGRRTFGEKLVQMRLALALELRWSKREILEAYLNLVPLRGDLIGVRAGALGLFRQGPEALDNAQVALVTALVRSPAAERQPLAGRACRILRSLADSSPADVQAAHEACERARFIAGGIGRRPQPIAGENEAPHLARRLLSTPGTRVRSTLDGALQRVVFETLRNRLADLAERNVEDGAVVVLDNATGEVLAYVGSVGDQSAAGDVDGAAALRQPGSALKPFLYALAIDERWLTAASLLADAPLSLDTPAGPYVPQNYARDFKGAVSVRTALGSSLNVPAVRTLTLVGVDRFHDHLRRLGLFEPSARAPERAAEHFGYGLALGAGEVELLALANAYRALANGGWWSPVVLVAGDSDGEGGGKSGDEAGGEVGSRHAAQRRVFGAAASHIVADMLADPLARAPTFGLGSALSTRGWAAVKTGTSKEMRDNWTIGFTDRYTVGVWVGNASGAPMWDVSGVTGAAPVWQAIVDWLHRDVPSRAPAAPPGVSTRTVHFDAALDGPRTELFVAGTEVEQMVAPPPAATRARLIAPPAGTVLAIDPDIPNQRQRMRIEVTGAGCLRLGDRQLAACGTQQIVLPLPLPGRHVLTLHASDGSELDRVAFHVRPLPAVGRARWAVAAARSAP